MMKRYPLVFALALAVFCAAIVSAQTTAGSDAGAPADTQPAEPPPATGPTTSQATQPAEPVNPRLSPAHTVRYFQAAVAENRLEDALRCLSFVKVDEEVRRARGAEYVGQLADILGRLEAAGQFDPARLPENPAAPPQSIGKDPVLLVLERVEREYPTGDGVGRRTAREWVFSSTTVAALPELHAKLVALAQARAEQGVTAAPEPEPPVAPPAEADPLRSPYHMVQHFLVKVSEAGKNAAAYNDAMACLDFTGVPLRDGQADGPRYVDTIAAILAALRASGDFERETLPKDAESQLETVVFGADPLLIILVRQNNRWRFSGDTVARAPEMFAAMRAAAEGRVTAGATPGAGAAMRLDTSSAQATVNLFLTAMNANDVGSAVRTLDLARLDAAERELAKLLAGKLWMVLNRHEVIVLQDLPADPEYPEPYTILNHTAGRIEVDQVRTGERAGQWLFTAATVRSIENLYEAFQSKPVLADLAQARVSFWTLPSLYVREYLVPPTLNWRLWGLQAWQWAGITGVLLAGVLLREVFGRIVRRATAPLLQADSEAAARRSVRAAVRPTSLLVMIAAWWAGVQFLDLGAPIMSRSWWGLRILLIFCAVWACYMLIDLFVGFLAARAQRTAARLDEVLVPLLQKTLKVVTLLVGLILVAQAFGVAVTPLVAGLGVGGLAFGLAAQDTLKNFFGSVNVVLDRPFQVGDWVIVGATEGTVESVGLRSTRIRTFYNSEVTIPNSELANARIDNMGRRRYRRTQARLLVLYDTTPEALEAFCEGIRELIRRHPFTRKDQYQVAVAGFSDPGIEILVNCYHECPDSNIELRERQRLLLDILRLAHRLGVQFGFPGARGLPLPPPGMAGTLPAWRGTDAGRAAAGTDGADGRRGAATVTALTAGSVGAAQKLGREQAGAVIAESLAESGAA